MENNSIPPQNEQPNNNIPINTPPKAKEPSPTPPAQNTNPDNSKPTSPPPSTNNQPGQTTPPSSGQKPPNLDEITRLKESIAANPPANNQTPPTNTPAGNSNTLNTIINVIKNPKIIIGAIIAIVIIVVGTGLYYTFYYNVGQLKLSINETPDTITINNQTYDPTNQLDLQLKPGTYTINLNKNNYFPLQTSFNITPQETTDLSLSFTAYPTPSEIVDFPTSFAYLSPNQTEISYLSNYGTTFYRVDLTDYTKDVISPNTFNNIDNIFWAPSAKKACIIQSTNNDQLKDFQTENILYKEDRKEDEKIFHLYDFSKYDLTSQTLTTYPNKIKNPSWHPTEEAIIYQYIDQETGENSLSKSLPNLDKKELLYDLEGFNNAIVKYSPNSELIAIVDTEPNDTSVNNIYIFDNISRDFNKIPTKDYYINFLWSPDSQHLIGIKDSLQTSLINIETFDTVDLPFNADIKHLAWLNNSTQIIAAITSPTSNDQLIMYDISAGQPSDLVFTSDIEFTTITQPFVSRDDSTLYFIGTDKEHIYSLEIKTNSNNNAEILTEQ